MRNLIEQAAAPVHGRSDLQKDGAAILGTGAPPTERDVTLSLSHAESPRRADTERFIQSAYQRAFGARILQFHPNILELRLGNGRLICATGIRTALDQQLYLEHYLPRPIECMIADHRGPLGRSRLVEIGHFAVASRHWIKPFFSLIGRWISCFEVEWIAFTLTRPLRRIFHQARVPLLDLAPARPECLPDNAEAWGRYYRHDPRVMAVPVREGLARFDRYLRQDDTGEIPGGVAPTSPALRA